MPFPPIDLSRVPDERLRKAISDGIALRERELTRFETENVRITGDLTATRNDLQTARNDLQTARTDAEAGKRQVAELGSVITDQQTQLKSRATELGKLRQDLAAANDNMAGVKRELEFAKARIADLLGKIEPANVPRPKMKVDQLVNGLRTQIESLNAEAIRKKVDGSMLVEGCEVEIKGGLDVSDGVQLVTLAESVLGANTVSTLRFVLRPAPAVRIADDE
jgi:chromosome segregation ATPase